MPKTIHAQEDGADAASRVATMQPIKINTDGS